MQNGRFPISHFRQSCKAFIGLSIRAKMIDGERPLQRESEVTTVGRNVLLRTQIRSPM